MVGFNCKRGGGAYTCEIALLPLETVANTEKKVPREWINEAGNGILPPFTDYALPLIAGETEQEKVNGLPRFAKLKKIIAE
jgi:6-phosphofructokinase 1